MHKDVQKTVVTVYQTFILDASTVHTHTHMSNTLYKTQFIKKHRQKKPTHLTRKKKYIKNLLILRTLIIFIKSVFSPYRDKEKEELFSSKHNNQNPAQ